jgi:spermidine/putrescine transport system permease protein
VTLAYMVWAIVPILVAIRFSFNEGRSRSTAQGWSTRWYWDDPDLSVWNDPSLRQAVFQSLELASLAMLLAVPLGVLLALALTRWRGRASGAARFVSLFPLVTPEIVMGTALFLTFVHLLDFVELGTTAQVIGHVTFSISFVVIIVRSRLLSIGPEYEEAAMDLGASPRQALRMVLLPLLAPAIFASLMIVFAISIDDFVISAFLSSDARTETVPIKIYSNARGAPTPALNAVASVMLVVSLLAIGLAVAVLRLVRRARGERGGTVEDFAGLRI